MRTLLRSVRSCVESHYPILYLVTSEEAKGDELIRKLADGRKVQEWNMARGTVHFDTKAPLAAYMDLPSALDNWLDQELDNHFLIVRDAHAALRDDPVAVARLKALANRIVDDDATTATVFLISSQLRVPRELEKFITVFDPPPPEENEIDRFVRDYVAGYGEELDDGTARKLTLAFRGLSEYEIVRLLNRGYQQDGRIDAGDIKLVLAEKRQIVKKSGGVLEMVTVAERMEAVGGLKTLKAWLKRKAEIMADLPAAQAFGVEMPKGVMIVGAPGCGKSLTAKAASALFGLPLLRLDVGTLMGRYVGDSEANMRRALSLAEDVSPCVLWVDEVEKAFAGIGSSGSEITTRLFSYFLTWLQEKERPVFVLATANDIFALPPEFLRKGRFDEVFAVRLPTITERAEILKVHLEKREKHNHRINIDSLAHKTDLFSGAELESVVKDAIEKAFLEGKIPLTTKLLSCVIENTKPLAKTMKGKFEEIDKKLCEMEVKRAS